MIRRNITSNLLEALADTPVVLLNGARQTGKSTLANAIVSETFPAKYLTLDDLSVLSAARSDPAGFLAGMEGPFIIDEAQKAPELFPAIKAAVDRNRRPGRFLLTGSANVFLLPRISESLAGRIEILTLWPFSQGEITGVKEGFIDALFESRMPVFQLPFKTKASILDRVMLGGYPEVISRAAKTRRKVWFESYVTTLLQRDVRDLARIEGLVTLPKLLSLLAVRVPTILNFSELSRTAAVPQSSLKRYMALLEATFLLQTIPAWSGNLGKRLVKAPKLVMNDSGLKTHLLGLDAERIMGDVSIGAHLENFVIMEFKKQISWSQLQPRMYHFRTQTGWEVDVVLEDSRGRIVGIEIKAAGSVVAQDFKSLKALAEGTGRKFIRGIVLYTGPEMIPFGSNLHAVPMTALWNLGVRPHEVES